MNFKLFFIKNRAIWYKPQPILFGSSNTTIFILKYSTAYLVYSRAFSGFLISSFVSLYSLNTILTETISSWLIYGSIKALE